MLDIWLQTAATSAAEKQECQTVRRLGKSAATEMTKTFANINKIVYFSLHQENRQNLLPESTGSTDFHLYLPIATFSTRKPMTQVY